jgi:hypothetical protein
VRFVGWDIGVGWTPTDYAASNLPIAGLCLGCRSDPVVVPSDPRTGIALHSPFELCWDAVRSSRQSSPRTPDVEGYFW